MAEFIVPSPLVDQALLPPPLLTSEPGSFARNTLAVRVPRILQDVIEQNSFTADVADGVAALRTEILEGRIRPLQEEAADAAFWNRVSEPHLGRSWLDVPWYWAETYVYRRLLEATRYFQAGPGQGFDPFAVVKRAEWQPGVAPAAAAEIIAGVPDHDETALAFLLQASLWGNRIDLSYRVATHLGTAAGETGSDLLIDDRARVWSHLTGRRNPILAWIADNAGTELALDLVAIDFLLSRGVARQIDLHVKPQPFYVSDTLPQDIEVGLGALAAAGGQAADLAARVRAHLSAGRLQVHTSWFYPTSLFYSQPPADLLAELSRMDLVVLKGDVNYRRLVGDLHWPHTTPFAGAVAYFPAPVVSLRTLKAELIVGLQPGEAEKLQASDPRWLVNGRRGVIQARL